MKIFFHTVFLLSIILMATSVNAATSLSYVYDANGNLISGDGKYYEYNDANQLVRVKYGDQNGPVIAEYVYDYSGQRIKKIDNGVTTYYIGKHFETQTDGSNTQNTSYYFANGERVAKKDALGNMAYYHSDHLGGTNVVTDSGGNLVERIRYYPFGEIREGENEKYSFTGKEKDKLTDNYYFEARYYNPEFKHFTQADTIEPKLYDPQDLNRYAYVRNNPLRLIDPTGHEFVDPSGHKWKSKDNYGKFSKALKDSQKYAEKSAKAQRAYMDLLNYYMTALEVPSGLGDMAIAIRGGDLGGLLKSTADTSLVFYRLGFDINGPKSIFELPGYIEGSEKMRGIGETVNVAFSFKNLYKLKGQSLDSAKTILSSTKTVLNFYDNASNFFHWNPW